MSFPPEISEQYSTSSGTYFHSTSSLVCTTSIFYSFLQTQHCSFKSVLKYYRLLFLLYWICSITCRTVQREFQRTWKSVHKNFFVLLASIPMKLFSLQKKAKVASYFVHCPLTIAFIQSSNLEERHGQDKSRTLQFSASSPLCNKETKQITLNMLYSHHTYRFIRFSCCKIPLLSCLHIRCPFVCSFLFSSKKSALHCISLL